MFGSGVAQRDNQRLPRGQPPAALRPVTAKIFGGDRLWRRLDVARVRSRATTFGQISSMPTWPRAPANWPATTATSADDLVATVELRGFGHNRTALGGNGHLYLHNANIYELPLMISMLKILSIKVPDPNAFSQSDIDFHIQGEHVYFDKLDFKGDAISLLGKGEMNFQGDTDMVLAATVGHADAGVPALRNLFSRSESAVHADSRQRQLAESRHPPGSFARRESGVEKLDFPGEPMSIGPMSSIAGSVAGTSLAQTRGSDIDRAQQESAARELRDRSDEKAEMAAGIGQADGDNHQTAERDADGRRLWEFPRRQAAGDAGHDEPPRPRAKTPPARAAASSI